LPIGVRAPATITEPLPSAIVVPPFLGGVSGYVLRPARG
jgi:hypothetical protein